MKIIDTSIPDVKIIEPSIFRDERGFFMESWRHDWFIEHVGKKKFVQENHSRSTKGTLRGLHYQTANTQGKLIRVVQGELFDVAVDMRKSSPTFGKWVGYILSAENMRQMWIPEGFAHGFYAMSDCVECLYHCTDYYNPGAEQSVRWDDKIIGIKWPLKINELPILSCKDTKSKPFSEAIYFE